VIVASIADVSSSGRRTKESHLLIAVFSRTGEPLEQRRKREMLCYAYVHIHISIFPF
jgi:hypothetical protein